MPQPRTPLRRVSIGSLSALARSGSYPDAPVGLGFLEPALSSYADEVETLSGNLQSLQVLEKSLEDFNAGFASYLYMLKMNAFVTEWNQRPSEESFALAEERKQRHEAALQRTKATEKIQVTRGRTPEPGDRTTATEPTGDSTFAHLGGDATTISAGGAGPSGTATTKKVVKKKGKPVLSAKEKKERGILMEATINALPLEFRGGDPTLRHNTERVIEGLLDASKSDGVKLIDLIRPDCNQARVNKILLALINRKMVNKVSNAGLALYHWVGPPQ